MVRIEWTGISQEDRIKMFRKLVFIAVATFVAGSLPACFLDPEQTPPPEDKPAEQFKDLTEQNDVLFNLRESYDQRNGDEYDRLVDDDFVFFFSDGDVATGNYPAQWSRETDVPATRGLFRDAINVDLTLQLDQVSWISFEPDQDLYPGETWWTTSVQYDFNMRFGRDPDTTWISTGASAQFTIRQVEKNGKMIWRLVRWRDLDAQQ